MNFAELLWSIGIKPRTVSSVGILAHTGRLLQPGTDSFVMLVERGDDSVGTVSLPAGRLGRHESPLQAAYRELREETGITMTEAMTPILHFPRTKIKNGRLAYVDQIIYRIQVPDEQFWGTDKWKWGYIFPTGLLNLQSNGFEWRMLSKPITNPEIRSLRVISALALLDLGKWLPVTPEGYFKPEIIDKLHVWAWREWRKNLSEHQKTAREREI